MGRGDGKGRDEVGDGKEMWDEDEEMMRIVGEVISLCSTLLSCALISPGEGCALDDEKRVCVDFGFNDIPVIYIWEK
jgi:hypothetical protein